MKYKCLVMDHDDTVVNSTATVHFPCFMEYLQKINIQRQYTLEEYFLKNFDPGMVALLRDELGMDEAGMQAEHDYWNEYVQSHFPAAYDGIGEILHRHKENGGIICVVSHSISHNIRRDWQRNGLPEPDMVFGWEAPAEQRKPNPYPLEQIMQTYHLQPHELLVVDDLKPGYDMAKTVNVPFAAAGWSCNVPKIEAFMRKNSDFYFKTIEELNKFLAES